MHMRKKIKSLFVFMGGLLVGCVLCNISLKYIDNVLSGYKHLIDFLEVIISVSTIVSVFLIIKQIKLEHEKSRREKTIDILMTWSTNLTPETNLAVKIVENFDREQCNKLYKMEDVYVSKEVCYEIKTVYSDYSMEQKKAMCKFQSKKGSCTKCKMQGNGDKEKVTLNKYYVKKLRHSIIQYLNLLETVLAGWQNSIVDKDIIEQQFSYLYDLANNKNCLQDFRVAAGSESSYPCIEAFCVKLEDKRKSKIMSKDYIA